MALVKPISSHLPGCDQSDASVAMHVIPSVSAAAGDVDLAQIALKPAWAPQRLTLVVAAGGSVVLTEESAPGSPAETFTVIVPANSPLVIQRPIRTVVKAGSGAVQVIAEWWDRAGSNAWNGTVP
jgi:hypothetical protein